MNCGWPGSSVHGISQARILEWGPYLSLGGLFDPEIELHLLHLLHCRWILYHWAAREAHRLLYIEWINKIPLFSPGNYNQYPVINIMEKNIYIYKCIYTHTHTHTHTRRAQQPTPVFSPGESHGQCSLAGCSPWGDMECICLTRLSAHTHIHIYISEPLCDIEEINTF